MKPILLLGALVSLSSASAQNKPPATGFDVGAVGIGPSVGIGGLGGASFSFGGRFERAVRRLPGLGDGVLGIGVDADYYSYSSRGLASVSYVPIGVAANYHFTVDEKRWDPFVGLGLGYAISSVSAGGVSASGATGLYLIGRAGIRYFRTDKMAIQVDAGAGAASLNLGLIFKL